MSGSCSYTDLPRLKEFYQQNPLHPCFTEQQFSPLSTFEFIANLAYQSEDMGRCISLIVNIINITMLEKFNLTMSDCYKDDMVKGKIITAICNNEALNHGSNLHAMSSCIKDNLDGSYDINVFKPVITNVGAADLLFVCLPIWGGQSNQFAIVLFEKDELIQKNCSDKLAGLSTCPTGSVIAELKNYQPVKWVCKPRHSLFVMRHMFNMERFLIGAIMTGILKKVLKYAMDECDKDSQGKFSNQYLQDKIIKIYESFIKLESLMKNCIGYMNIQLPVESILSLIKMACIDEGRAAILLLNEICGGKSYFKDHISTKLLADHEAIINLGGTKELMKQTLYQDLQSKMSRKIYV